jgi:hypothetical protein
VPEGGAGASRDPPTEIVEKLGRNINASLADPKIERKVIFVHGCFWHGQDCAHLADLNDSES